MSTTVVAPPSLRQKIRRNATPARALIAVAVVLVLFSLVRTITDANDLTSPGTVGAALRLAVPIGLAGLGGLWSERAGVVNIGLEGMMILGTWFGAWAGYQWGPWWGVLAGILGGALAGVLHATATVIFGVDHIVSGVAITILAGGVTRYLSAIAFVGVPGGGITQSPSVANISTVTVPGVSDWLITLSQHHWFLVSDIAGILAGLTTQVSQLTIVAVLLVPLTYLVLWRTAFGLRLRSVGESPIAAESLGVNVYRMKFVAVVISGGLAGLGGAFLSEVAGGIYREGQTNGRGYIGLAAMIFGNWRPGGLAAGAGLFGFTDALQLRSGGTSVHALLLLIAILLLFFAVYSWVRHGSRGVAVTSIGIASAAVIWYSLTDTVPQEFVLFAPHITTLLVLALASQRLRPPAADGQPYRRGQGG
ncbi:MAG: ABC transporter permease [Actinomycetes bacterium]